MTDLSTPGPGFSGLDLAALVYFLLAWTAYGLSVGRLRGGRISLSRIMDRHRENWARQVIVRDNRVVDTQINASLQNGTAFFASTSLIALGSVLTLTRSGDDVINLFATLPFGTVANRLTWEVKVAGLACVFTYAFFKFAWAYRLFNYSAILLGAVPPRGSDIPEREMLRTVQRIAAMNVTAGSHFARGQRAFFFALAYLGWFVSPIILFGSTTFVVAVMLHRQFGSRIRHEMLALGECEHEGPLGGKIR